MRRCGGGASSSCSLSRILQRQRKGMIPAVPLCRLGEMQQLRALRSRMVSRASDGGGMCSLLRIVCTFWAIHLGLAQAQTKAIVPPVLSIELDNAITQPG